MVGELEGRNGSSRNRRSGRWMVAGGIGGAAATILLMTLAPLALGGAVHPLVLTAPFTGVAHASSSSGYSGCAKERTTVAPALSLKTGFEQWSGWAKAKTCASSLPGTGSASWAYIAPVTSLAVKFTVSTSGPHSIYADGNFSINVSAAISTKGSCPTSTTTYSWGTGTSGYCSAYAEGNYFGLDYIQDLTNGSIFVGDLTSAPAFYVSNTVSIDWGCYNAFYGGGCFSHNSSFVTPFTTLLIPTGTFYGFTWDNGTLASGHQYAFHYDEYHDVLASVTGWTFASAYASENEATAGNYGQLTSVHVL